MSIKKFDREDALAIFSACGLDKDVVKREEVTKESDHETSNVAQMLLVDEQGIWPNLEVEKYSPNLGTEEYKLITWRPALELVSDAAAPDVKKTPALPFPFTANELAAFMVDGVGASLVDFFGDWTEGPLEDRLNDINQNFNKAKEALRDAYQAYRTAEEIVEKLDKELIIQALLIEKNYKESNNTANSKHGVFKRRSPRNKRMSRKRRLVRRNRAKTSVAVLRTESRQARKQSDDSVSMWRKAMVIQLLKPSHPQEEIVQHSFQPPAKPLVHKIRNRAPGILATEIAQAKKTALDAKSFDSVWDELIKLAISKFGAMVGFTEDGIQYRGRKYQAGLTLDVFTKRALRERMDRGTV